jgi:hypothetical protein
MFEVQFLGISTVSNRNIATVSRRIGVVP